MQVQGSGVGLWFDPQPANKLIALVVTATAIALSRNMAFSNLTDSKSPIA